MLSLENIEVMQSLGAEARDPGVGSSGHLGLPQGDIAGAGEHYDENVTWNGWVAKGFESRREPQLGL